MAYIVKNVIVVKSQKSITKALSYAFFYNTFKYHVKTIPVYKFLIYRYQKGPTLHDMIGGDVIYQDLNLIMVDLAKKLSENHKRYIILSRNYAYICRERRLNNDVAFISKNHYFSKTHGDLNTKNIIVNNNKVVFIDRLSFKGDLLFDFTFILSMVCHYYRSCDIKYLVAVKIFFDNYDNIFTDKDSFYNSFRDNFINYCTYAYNDSEHRKSFPEWSFCKILSEELSKFASFKSYLDYKINQDKVSKSI